MCFSTPNSIPIKTYLYFLISKGNMEGALGCPHLKYYTNLSFSMPKKQTTLQEALYHIPLIEFLNKNPFTLCPWFELFKFWFKAKSKSSFLDSKKLLTWRPRLFFILAKPSVAFKFVFLVPPLIPPKYCHVGISEWCGTRDIVWKSQVLVSSSPPITFWELSGTWDIA